MTADFLQATGRAQRQRTTLDDVRFYRVTNEGEIQANCIEVQDIIQRGKASKIADCSFKLPNGKRSPIRHSGRERYGSICFLFYRVIKEGEFQAYCIGVQDIQRGKASEIADCSFLISLRVNIESKAKRARGTKEVGQRRSFAASEC